MIRIDNNNYEHAFFAEGGAMGLWQFPPLKAPKMHEWQEEDGAEVDLSSPRLDAKSGECVMHVLSESEYQAVRAKIEAARVFQTQDEQPNEIHLSSEEVVPQGITITPTEVKEEIFNQQIRTLYISYTQHQPTAPDRDVQPNPEGVMQSDDFKIDNIRVSEFGARALIGSTESFLIKKHREWHTMKHPLLTGQLADRYAPTRYKPFETTIRLLWRANSLQQLWNNRQAFLARLTLPEARQIEVKELGKRFAAIYKSESVTDFYPQNAWLESSITFTIIKELK